MTYSHKGSRDQKQIRLNEERFCSQPSGGFQHGMFYSVNTLQQPHRSAEKLFSHVQNSFIEHPVYEVVPFEKSAETENLETS